MHPQSESVIPSVQLLIVDANALLAAQPDGRWQSFDLCDLLHQPVEVLLTALATHNGPTSHSAQLLTAWLAENHSAMMLIIGAVSAARHQPSPVISAPTYRVGTTDIVGSPIGIALITNSSTKITLSDGTCGSATGNPQPGAN